MSEQIALKLPYPETDAANAVLLADYNEFLLEEEKYSRLHRSYAAVPYTEDSLDDIDALDRIQVMIDSCHNKATEKLEESIIFARQNQAELYENAHTLAFLAGVSVKS